MNNIDVNVYLKLDIHSKETKDMFREYLPATYYSYIENTEKEYHMIKDVEWNFDILVDIFQDNILLEYPDSVSVETTSINLLYEVTEE